MDILAKLIGLFVISGVLISVPVFFTLSIVLRWPFGVQVPLLILFVSEYAALVSLLCKSMTEKKGRRDVNFDN